jgi:hypothetical protein
VNLEYWLTLGAVLWKITRLVILPVAGCYILLWLAVVALRRAGLIDL